MVAPYGKKGLCSGHFGQQGESLDWYLSETSDILGSEKDVLISESVISFL